MPRLALENIRKSYGALAAVDGVSLDIEAGQVACLLGPSGCGKSTTLRIAAGVDRQDSGCVRIDGRPVSDDTRHDPPEARSIGLMFQDFALFPHLRTGENVAFGLRGLGRREKRAAAGEYLEKVGLSAHIDKYPHQLSGGEQQRVALARALAPKPRVMMMDEPFSGLDSRLRDDVRDAALSVLKEENAAVLMVTHDPGEALRMADFVALMRDGRVAQMGAPYHVYNHPVDRKAAAFFSDLNVIHGIVGARQTDTPFGRFLTPGLADGADVEIVVRPQHLTVDDGAGPPPDATARTSVAARGVVARARFIGSESLIEARMDFDGSILRATLPGVWLPQAGAPLWLSMRRDQCFVFPCERQSRLKTPWLDDDSACAAQ